MFVTLQKRIVMQPYLMRSDASDETTRRILVQQGIRLTPFYCAGVARQAQQERNECLAARILCSRHNCDCVRSVVLEYLVSDFYFPELSRQPYMAGAYRLASKLESLGSSMLFSDTLDLLMDFPEQRKNALRYISQITGIASKEYDLWI